jgi:hypothetical protein
MIMIVLAFYEGHSLLSKIIKWETRSTISHVSILQLPDDVFDPKWETVKWQRLRIALESCPLWEAWASAGVVRRTGIHDGHKPGTVIHLMRLEGEVAQYLNERAVVAFLEGCVERGVGYDWLGLVRFGLRINRHSDRRMFCSELAQLATGRGGIELLRRVGAHFVAPGDQYRSPILTELFTVRTRRARSPQEASQATDAPTPAFSGSTHLQGHTAQMQGHSAALLADRGLCAANSAASASESAANAATLAAPGFVVLQEDGLFVPFGDFPHDVGIQRFDAEAANALIAELAGNPDGCPVYRGHPDVPGMMEDWPDRDAKGWTGSAEITAHNGVPGCRFRVKYNADGLDIIRQAKLKFPSPFWRLKAIGTAENGQRIVAPVALISIGLVNNPNIPVPAVANSATPQPQPGGQTATEKEIAMREKLIAMLRAASVEVPEGATDEQLLALVQQTVSTANQETEAEKQKAAEAVAKAESEKTNAANARKTAAGAIVDLAIVQGKVPQAKRDEWLGKFDANFAAANVAVSALDPVIPLGAARSASVAGRQPKLDAAEMDAANARKEFLSLVDQEQTRLNGIYGANSAKARDTAWDGVARANAALYARAYPKKQ